MDDTPQIISVDADIPEDAGTHGYVSCHIYQGHTWVDCDNISDTDACRAWAIRRGCDAYSQKTSFCP